MLGYPEKESASGQAPTVDNIVVHHFVNLAGWQNGGKQYNIESECVKQVYTVQ